MNEKRINDLTGWGVFLVALVVYLLTMAPTASFWDCGEFIACANELEVTHPPGAPLFLILGRIFSLFSFGDVTKVAFMVNLLSALSSAFTALFTCWTVTILAKKSLAASDMENSTKQVATLLSGVIGGLACTFADSIWFNAVEAEVYGMSSFFTAIVVWLMFKWEARADEPDHLRWILLIAYVMGLSIGVHLLNLLTIPALAVIYYLRKFPFSLQGLFATLGISVVLLAVILYGIIQYTFSTAWAFEKLFTGTISASGEDISGWGLPMGTGSVVLAVIILAIVIGTIILSHRKRRVVLNTALLAFTLITIGFSSYGVIFIRSKANPPVDMNNPENILTFLSYMKREQYGDRPLFRGPMYNARFDVDSQGYPKTKSKGMKYVLLDGKTKYVEDMEDVEYLYKSEDRVFFPRMYDPGHYSDVGAFSYINFVKRLGADKENPEDDTPTRLEDFNFFLQYQLNHMYLRYFMWNFAGRASDEQEARWEDGLFFRAAERNMDNKGNNHYFFLPMILGLMGMIWQVVMRRKDAFVVGLLFFFTGVAIVLYLNQYPLQPRERDYSYAGSFQTFCIWIGLGVLFLTDQLRRFAGKNAVWLAGVIALIAPALMMIQNWDDHTRRGRYVDIEFAKNLLNSCEKNAILFTAGDNDTFPLWYIQEVEGFRTDVRVVNLELLISDWYIEQMTEPKNQSEALPITMDKKDYIGEKGLVIYGFPSRNISLPVQKDQLFARGVITEEEAQIAGDEMVWEFKSRGGSRNPYIFRKDSVIINMLRNIANDGWKRPVYFANTMPPSSFVNLQDYFRMEGMAFRVLPIKRTEETANDIYFGRIGQDIMYKKLTEEFLYTGMDDPSVNFDEHIREVIIGNYRNCFFRLCNSYTEQILRMEADSLADHSAEVNQLRTRIEELVRFADKKMPHSVVPKNLTLLITQGQMLEQIGLSDLALDEFHRLKPIALADLHFREKHGYDIDQNTLSLRAAVIAIQIFTRRGLETEAMEIASEIQKTTKSPIGFQIIEQMKQ
ncbi:MAG: DUF2723 domain-containing protein [Bacteroidia bacterium]|nr:DUF2723 domain-containing protein [Bacteroidia bacterium]